MEIPIISFGIITDVQYADIPDGLNYTGDKVRYYRNSVCILSDAIKEWNAAPCKISFVLQLGDIIDGCNAKIPGASEKSLEQVTRTFSELKCPVYHVTGNHELYNFKRNSLKKTVIHGSHSALAKLGHSDKNYYTFRPVDGFRVIVLDTLDVSLLGLDEESTDYEETMKLLRKYNPNKDLNDSSGLAADLCMYAAYNGAVSDMQLKWLEETLTKAERDKEKVIIAGHNPICMGSAITYCLCWNHASVLEVLQRHSLCILAYLAGHDHSGGYAQDKAGISHITFPGVVDTEPGNSCHATVHIFMDRMKIEGFGVVQSYTLPFRV